MSWSPIILILTCMLTAVLLVLLIREEKKHTRLRHRLDGLLSMFTALSKDRTYTDNGHVQDFEDGAGWAYKNAAHRLEEVLNKED